MNFGKNLFKNAICFDNIIDSANQIAGFCQIIVTDNVFEEIFVKFHFTPSKGTLVDKCFRDRKFR